VENKSNTSLITAFQALKHKPGSPRLVGILEHQPNSWTNTGKKSIHMRHWLPPGGQNHCTWVCLQGSRLHARPYNQTRSIISPVRWHFLQIAVLLSITSLNCWSVDICNQKQSMAFQSCFPHTRCRYLGNKDMCCVGKGHKVLRRSQENMTKEPNKKSLENCGTNVHSTTGLCRRNKRATYCSPESSPATQAPFADLCSRQWQHFWNCFPGLIAHVDPSFILAFCF